MLNKKKAPPHPKKKKKKKEKRNENLTATAIESEYTAIVVSEIISVNSRYYHIKDILISYSVATTTGQKGLYLFYKVSESNRRILTMSLVGHYYYGNISAIK